MPSKNSMPSPQKSAPKPVTQGSELAENLENAFLAMCLRHLNMETKKVDACAVAEALGYSNAKSAGNRFCALRKKYNLRLEMSYPRNETKSSAKTTTNKVQKTPTKRGGNKKINSSPESQRENDFETEDFAETGVSGSMESYVEENDGDDEGGVSTGLKKENKEYETSDY